MNPAGALVLLGALLLLTSGGDCDVCSPVKKDVSLFLDGSTDEYVNYVAGYNANPAVLENAANLKECLDGKLTEEDKAHVRSALKKIYSSPLC